MDRALLPESGIHGGAWWRWALGFTRCSRPSVARGDPKTRCLEGGSTSPTRHVSSWHIVIWGVSACPRTHGVDALSVVWGRFHQRALSVGVQRNDTGEGAFAGCCRCCESGGLGVVG